MDFRHPLRVVTPTLDADVLEVLARADIEMSGREIQRLAEHGSHQGIRNAADRLTEQGIVLRRAAGGAHLYRLNRDHLAAHLIEEMGDVLPQLVQRLRATIGNWVVEPAAVLLFGSVSTGGAGDTSDIDLLVIRATGCDPESPEWQQQLALLEEQATRWTGNDARIVEYDESEIVDGRADNVVREALQHGIALYGEQRALLRSATSRRAS